MKLCNFILNNDVYECEYCGFKVKKPNTKKVCKGKPTLIDKAKNFTKSIVNHTLHGSPKASQELIDERLAICNTCEFFEKKSENEGSCGQCGCPLKRDMVFRNKLAWADEECPIGKWKSVYNNSNKENNNPKPGDN